MNGGNAIKHKSGSKYIVENIAMFIISFVLSIFLFLTVLDNLLLWQFQGAFIHVSLRILLALVIFIVIWSLIRRVLPKKLVWMLGIMYSLVLLYVIILKTSYISGVNLNPFTLVSDVLFIPFYPIANFLSFIPIGIFVRYATNGRKFKTLYIYGFIGSILLETIQYVLHNGIVDINDVITNGFGFALGVWLYSKAYKNTKFRNFLNSN